MKLQDRSLQCIEWCKVNRPEQYKKYVEQFTLELQDENVPLEHWLVYRTAGLGLKDQYKEHAENMIHHIIEHICGNKPGGFFERVYANDLFGALAKADHMNRVLITIYAEFIATYVPMTFLEQFRNKFSNQ